VSSEAPQAPRTRASRLRRQQHGRRRRSIELLVAIVVVTVGVGYAFTQIDEGDRGGSDDGGSPSPDKKVPALLVFEVDGAPKPLLAVIGSAGSPPAAMGFPQGLILAVPGAGELSTRQVAALPGPGLQVALSNVVGAWAEHYAITDLDHLVPLVDRNGGLRVQLPDPVTIGDVVLGPGAVTMTGAQVSAFLGAEGQNTYTRWEIVLTAFLETPPAIAASDLTETDDLAGVQATLDGAEGGRLETLPIKAAAATIRVPDYQELDTLMADRFGVKRTPVPAIVQNAAGSAGIGEEVGRLLIPRGFRVTLSQNAVEFGDKPTQIIALGEDHLNEARRARAALGVGRIAVSQVASGIGDIQIVVGKDFTA
jgi:hypothetical protein